MDLRGANQTIQRLERARQKKENDEKFWEKKPKNRNKSVKEFNFSIH